MKNPKLELALAALRLQAVRSVLESVTREADDRAAGRRALLLAYIVAPELIGTQRQLAARLGVTEGRASQMLKVLRRHFSKKFPALVDSR